MNNKIDIKVYTKFKNDLKDKDNTIDLFYYYLDNDKAGTNEGTDDFAGKTDNQLDDNDRFEAKVSSGQGKLHILSTDIIDDVTLVSKLVDPYILSDGYKYIYVMYRLTTIDDPTAKYYYAFRVELDSQSSEITANDYNYLYFDLTEFGSVLAKIRLNNTSPIYKTSHSVSSDGKHNGSGVQGKLIGPNSNSEISDPEDDSLFPVPNITVKNAFRDDRTYTEEFYHMGDFTIRLLGKTLPNAPIIRGRDTYDSTFDLNDVNLMTVLNPESPNTRTLRYLSFNDLRNAFKPRFDNERNALAEITLDSRYTAKYFKIIEYTTNATNSGVSFRLVGDKLDQFIRLNFEMKNGSGIIDFDKSFSYGYSDKINVYALINVVDAQHSILNIKILIKCDGSNRTIYLSDITKDAENSVIDLFASTLNYIIDLPSGTVLDSLNAYFIDSNIGNGPLEPLSVKLNQATAPSTFDGAVFDPAKEKVTSKAISLDMDKVWNNCHELSILYKQNAVTINDVTADTAGDKEYDVANCSTKIELFSGFDSRDATNIDGQVIRRTVNSGYYLGDSTYLDSIGTNGDRFPTNGFLNSISRISTQLHNITKKWFQVGINISYNSTPDIKYIWLPPASTFELNSLKDSESGMIGSFINNGLSKGYFINPSCGDGSKLTDSDLHYRYGQSSEDYAIFDNSAPSSIIFRSNINKVIHFINNSDSPIAMIIYSHQNRFVNASYINSANNSISYGDLLIKTGSVCNTENNSRCTYECNGVSEYTTSSQTYGVTFSLPPHSMTAYSNNLMVIPNQTNFVLKHNMLYQIPIYYT